MLAARSNGVLTRTARSVIVALALAVAGLASAQSLVDELAWAYANNTGPVTPAPVDDGTKYRLPGSDREFTLDEIEAPPELLRYCVEKGSITVEGVSLTVAGLGDGSFSVALVPHTREATTLGAVAAGDEVNLEADVIAKHVERLVQPGYDPGKT